VPYGICSTVTDGLRICNLTQYLQHPALDMFGVTNCALVVLSVGCLTLALPLERKQRKFEPKLQYEDIKHGPPCETPAKLGDNVKVTLRELGVETERYCFKNSKAVYKTIYKLQLCT